MSLGAMSHEDTYWVHFAEVCAGGATSCCSTYSSDSLCLRHAYESLTRAVPPQQWVCTTPLLLVDLGMLASGYLAAV